MDFNAFLGIVEMDETYFLYSEKGKRGITGRIIIRNTTVQSLRQNF